MVARILVCVTLMGMLSSPASAASDRDWDECSDHSSPAKAELSIDACSRILSGEETPQDRAIAYDNRCAAWNARSEYDRAIADCNEAIRLAPKDGPAYLHRGIARHGKHDFDGAIADYGEAIRYDSKNGGAYLMRGIAWRAKGQHDRAIADFDEVIRRGADLDLAYYNRGAAWRAKGNFDRAIADYNKSIALQPSKDAYHERGLVWQAKSDFERAIADHTEAIRLDPKFQLAYFDRATAWNARGNLDYAIADYEDAISLKPDHAMSYANRGSVYFSRLDFVAASADFQRATELTGEPRAMLLRHVARARAGEGTYEELQANAARLKTQAWPYPAIELFLGRRSSETTLNAAGPSGRCLALLLIGEWHLLRNEPQGARMRLQAATNACPTTSFEHRAATAELGRLAP